MFRGKCVVYHLKDIGTTANDRKKLTRDDSFFYVLGYNPENDRLASILGEIRVGPSHQAKLPEFKQRAWLSVEPSAEAGDDQLQQVSAATTTNTTMVCLDEEERVRETLVWTPDCLPDGDILMYIRAAR